MAEVKHPSTMDSKTQLSLLLSTFHQLISKEATATLHSHCHGGKVKTSLTLKTPSQPSRPPIIPKPTPLFPHPNTTIIFWVPSCPPPIYTGYLKKISPQKVYA